MQYSVWNSASKRYDYYQTSQRSSATHAGAPPSALMASALGATVDQAAWSLPIGAQKIGEGEYARGRVCKSASSSLLPFAGIDALTTPPVLLAIAVGAYFWWRNR